MEITKLYKGLKVKNYRALCDLLGEKPKTGKSKQLHIKEMERYFKFHKEGNAIVIDEVYTQALEKVDNRTVGNNAIFKDDTLVNVIKIMLSKSQGNTLMVLPKHIMHKELALVNQYYHDLKHQDNAKLLNDITGVESHNSKYFFSSVDRSCESVVKSALNRLAKGSFVEWCETRVKVIIENVDKTTQKAKHILCTDYEVSCILEVERQVCEEQGYANTWEVSQAPQEDKHRYYQRVQVLLNAEYDIQYTYSYKAYKIVYSKRLINKNLKALGINSVDEYIDKVNDIFTNAILKKFERRIGKANGKNLKYEAFKKRAIGRPRPQESTEYALGIDDSMALEDNFMPGIESLVSTCMKAVVIDKLEKELIRQIEESIEMPTQVYECLSQNNVASNNKSEATA